MEEKDVCMNNVKILKIIGVIWGSGAIGGAVGTLLAYTGAVGSVVGLVSVTTALATYTVVCFLSGLWLE